jgi:uncharacterized protein (DUF1015 family)
MCRVRIEPFGQGQIYPHEETHGAAKTDRLRLWRACRANLSQIFSLYPDKDNTAQNIVEQSTYGVAPLEATDHLGVVHRIWPVTDVMTITNVIGAMGGRPMYIADGHHRYETAVALRDEVAAELAQNGEELSSNHAANFVLMMCVSMSDPGMLVLPTHRLFRGLAPITSSELIEKLGDAFDAHVIGQSASDAAMVWAEIESEADQGCMAFFTAKDQKWVRADVNNAGMKRMAEVAADHSADWQGLGVSILHRLVMETLLDAAKLPAPKYVRGIEEVVRGLKHGDTAGRDATGQAGTGGRFELAALVMPATVEHIRAISSHGERMPAKSTYFYPKLLSGLVINPLE